MEAPCQLEMFATLDPFLFWVDVVIGNYTDLGFLGALFVRDVCFVVGDFVRTVYFVAK